jgi:hypothetical protein
LALVVGEKYINPLAFQVWMCPKVEYTASCDTIVLLADNSVGEPGIGKSLGRP